jgi:molecular chaperone HtpG
MAKEHLKKETGKLSVDTENILPIIKKWLYSEHDIFLRELISNAHDAIFKLQRLKLTGEFTGKEPEYRIALIPDKEKNTLTIRDNGLGMDADEIKKYINQIAFSGAREFVKKYEAVKDQKNLIGHFGLGFYSSFMVADEVEVFSRSFKEEAVPVHWKSDGSISYELEEAEKEEVGTDVVLHLNEESKEYLQPPRLKELVRKYSNFLPVSIFLEGEQINYGEPLWTKSPNEVTDEEYKKFYQELFPGEWEPLFWLHLKTDYPFELRGILYFPKLMHELDATKGNLKLFVNNVFVGDNLKEITPDFLSLLMGALDSEDIPLNVSRSQLQGDPKVRKISSHIVKKVGEKLSEVFKQDRERYREIWEQIHAFIKFGAIQDDGFYEKVKDAMLFRNLEGQWVSLDEYVEANKEKNKNKEGKTLVLYLNEEKDNSAIEDMLRENGLEAVYTSSTIDSHLIDFLERKRDDIKFARGDSDLNEILFETVKTLDEKKELKNEKIPAMIMNMEQMRRFQEMSQMMSGKKMDVNLGSQIVLNGRSPLVQKVILLENTDKTKAEETVAQIFDIATLAAGQLQGERLKSFVKRSFDLLDDAVPEK